MKKIIRKLFFLLSFYRNYDDEMIE